jgi:hypothetical protein
VRVKTLNHPLDRAQDQFLVILGFHVILLNLTQHFREKFEAPVGFPGSRFDHDRIPVEKENTSDEKTEGDNLEKKSPVVSRHRITPDVYRKVSIMILQGVIPGQ